MSLSFTEESAKLKFGTTKECKKAFFILSNGEMLKGVAPSGNKYPHNAIELSFSSDITKEYNESPIVTFQRYANAIRLISSNDSIWLEQSTNNKITKSQKDTIEDCICSLSPKIIAFDYRYKIGDDYKYKQYYDFKSGDCIEDSKSLFNWLGKRT